MNESKFSTNTFLLTQLGALLLFLSWLLPPTALCWQWLDAAIFRCLNGSLQPNSAASHFWAWLNVRVADLLPAILLYTLMIVAAGRMGHAPRMRFIHRGLAVLVVMMVVITADNLIDLGIYSYHRASPTLVMEHPVRLSELVPAAKDHSTKCFPGDHGYVLVCLTLFFALASPPRYALMAVGIAVSFSLPRLIAGAHWMSDIVVGSGVKALLSIGWLVLTPLWDRFADAIEQILSRLPFNPLASACRLYWGEPEPEPTVAAVAEPESRRRAA